MVAAALTLTDLRRRASAKFSRAPAMEFTREGLEQASSEAVATLRASRFAGATSLVDLCTGIGGDLTQLAGVAPVLAVDRDPLVLAMAAHNAEVYGATISTGLADVTGVALAGVDALFVDPARRAAGRRVGPGGWSPPLAWCLGLAERVPAVGIKAAPGLAHDRVPAGWEMEFVSERGDLKEAALWSPAMATTARRATLLPGPHVLVAEPGPPVGCAAPGAYVVDPDPAVTRAGLVQELARSLGAWQLDARIAFLTLDAPVATPFGRLLRVEASLPWGEHRLRTELRGLDAGAVDVRLRGSPVDAPALARRLAGVGARRLTVLLTRLADRPWALVCSDVR